mgnify:CR=1 FL=1
MHDPYVAVKLENELGAALMNGIRLQGVIDEQNMFLKEAAETLDETDSKYNSIREQFNRVNNDLIMRTESSTDMEDLVFKKESQLVKLISNNEFNQKRIESLQRKVVKLSMYNDMERGNSSHAKEIKRLRIVLEQLDRKNDFLLNGLERETAEKTTLKKMLHAAYSEQEKANFSSKKVKSSQNTADIWGAMNKTPAFVGYDVIFKIDKLVPPAAEGRGKGSASSVHQSSVVERMRTLAIDSTSSASSNTPIDFFTLFQSQQKLDSRMIRAVERMLVGWSVLVKLHAKNKKPKRRIMRADISSLSLFCLPLNIKDDRSRSASSSSSANKNGLLLSRIDLVLKDFDSEAVSRSSGDLAHTACMLCIEVAGGERLLLQLPTECERNDFYDGLCSLLVKYNADSYKSRLIESMNIQLYHSSLYLQSIIAHSNHSGVDRFEEITGVLEPGVHVDDISTSPALPANNAVSSKESSRKIVTQKGSTGNSSVSASGSSSSSLSGLFSSMGSSRRLSTHETQPQEKTKHPSDDDKDKDSGHNPSTINTTTTTTQPEPFSHPSEQERVDSSAVTSCTPQENPPAPLQPAATELPKAAFSPLTKTSSLFSILNKKDKKEKQDVEINGIGNLYGSEKTEDRRHSINLSNEKGRRKSKFSFVSENPFSQELFPGDQNPNSTEPAEKASSNDSSSMTKEPPVRRRSSLFAHTNTMHDSQVTSSDSAGGGTEEPLTRPRGLSIETLARAQQLSLTLGAQQGTSNTPLTAAGAAAGTMMNTADETAEKSTSESRRISHQRSFESATRKSSMTTSPVPKSTSPVSVGAANAQRFGTHNNRIRANSGISRPNLMEPRRRLSRTTLMNVDSESLEVLRQKAQRRESASRELVSQTNNMLKKRLSSRRDSVS